MLPSQLVFANGQCYRNALHLKMEEALVAKAKERDQDPDWIETEQRMMLALINERRAELGKTPVDLEDVQRVEQNALGHFDYGHKFALYCAELAEETP